MSQGGIFSLVLRDERFDKYFTASDFLRERLNAIRTKNKDQSNPQPSFLDVEKSHVLHIHSEYKPYVSVASEYTKTLASGDGSSAVGLGGGSIQFTFPIFGHFTSDMMLRIVFKPLGSKSATTPSANTPYYRYCSYPGVRFLKKAELRSDQVLIDDYTRDDVMMNSKFFVGADELNAWNICMGQQAVKDASYFSNGYTGVLKYSDGAQTPKLYHDEVELLIPLQFQFCQDASTALLNDLIPNTQRTIVCELEALKYLVKAQIPNIVDPAILDDIALPISSLGISTAELYVNNLYVNPEIHDIFASRIGFSLIRVHRRQTTPLQTTADSIKLDQLKFPCEYLMVGFRSKALINDFDQWCLMGWQPSHTPTDRLFVASCIWDIPTLLPKLVYREAKEVSGIVNKIATLGVIAHGITIYPQMTSQFYNAYLPIKYPANSLLVSPRDPCVFLITFCLYPGKKDPSGYYNLSAGREMMLNYALKSTETLGMNEAEIVISMSALNFLIRKGDKISLKYAM